MSDTSEAAVALWGAIKAEADREWSIPSIPTTRPAGMHAHKTLEELREEKRERMGMKPLEPMPEVIGITESTGMMVEDDILSLSVLFRLDLDEFGFAQSEATDLLFGADTVECSCETFDKKAHCAHIGWAIKEGIDAPLIEHLLKKEDVAYHNLSIPIVDLAEGMLYALVRMHPKTLPGGRFGQINLFIPSESPAMDLEGTWMAAGTKYHRIGMVSGRDGREAIRALVSSWVATQQMMLEAAEVRIECTSFSHDGDVRPEATPLGIASVILTGECSTCYAKPTADISRDVPVF